MKLNFRVQNIEELQSIFLKSEIGIGDKISPSDLFEVELESIAKNRFDSGLIVTCLISFGVGVTANFVSHWIISALTGKTKEITINNNIVILASKDIEDVVSIELKKGD